MPILRWRKQKKKNNKKKKKIPIAPMGVLDPVSAHAGPSAQTPSALFLARVSAESISPNFPAKIGLIGGVGGIPQISFSFDSNIFVT